MDWLQESLEYGPTNVEYKVFGNVKKYPTKT